MAIKLFPVDSSELPVSKNFLLGKESFEFRFFYNKKFDFISFEIYREETFLYSSKLTYGNNMLKGFKGTDFKIIPLTENDLYIDSFSSLKVNFNTLGKSVNLFFNDGVEV